MFCHQFLIVFKVNLGRVSYNKLLLFDAFLIYITVAFMYTYIYIYMYMSYRERETVGEWEAVDSPADM